MESIYEVVKVINGYAIQRMKGTHGFYYVYYRENVSRTFHTIKAAAEFANALPAR